MVLPRLLLVSISVALAVHSRPSLWPVGLDSSRRWLLQDQLIQAVSGADSFDLIKTPDGFNALEATVEDIHDALFAGKASCRTIVSSFLTRIEHFNPQINAIITLNPSALKLADDIDHLLTTNTLSKPFPNSTLICIPILLKDNFDTSDLPTTSGSLSLGSSQPAHDAPTVSALRSAGAIILGKTNLHELAMEGLTVSSLGGQTLNPYDLTRTPGGSSGGSGAAVAASFCVFATGTDTVNSLRSPASANSVMSLRPSRGLITREGVVPAAGTQDSVGVIARCARDLMLGYRVMWSPEGELRELEVEDLDDRLPAVEMYEPPLKGLRFGILLNLEEPADPEVRLIFRKFYEALIEAGAEVVVHKDSKFEPDRISALDVQSYEFREDLNAYLSNADLGGNRPSSFEELFRRDDYMVIPDRYKHIQNAHNWLRDMPEYRETICKIDDIRNHLRETFDQKLDGSNKPVDFLLYPEQRTLVKHVGTSSQRHRNGHLAALTGFPVLAFPAGFSKPDHNAPRGVPIGVEIMGRELNDMKLLRLAARLELVFGDRVGPLGFDEKLSDRGFESVPVVVPNRTISDVYPLGRYY